MPTLKDTEWRLLCVLVRQTRGWANEHGERKTWDWVTQKQFQKRTGRNTGALSKALDVLVKRGLVMVQNGKGQALLTPQERRRANSPLFYSLTSATLASSAPAASATSDADVTEGDAAPAIESKAASESRVAKAACKPLSEELDLEKPRTQKPNAQSAVARSLESARLAKAQSPAAQSALRKAQTTKETPTKDLYETDYEKRSGLKRSELKRGGLESRSRFRALTLSKPLVSAELAARDTATKNRTGGIQEKSEIDREPAQETLALETDPTVLGFVENYQEQFQRHFPARALPHIEASATGHLGTLLTHHSVEELSRLLPKFFTCGLGHIERHNYSLRAFVHSIHILKAMR